ncbi:hypothetical protein D8674_011087 [Pyrus ussuriensis x Pyrus communis]|uniref:Uncharacterized protein n=1 Tax=Pyrus ussuriensis x Pyrus communis TaxID=2448454 RepID=A0A5N5FXR2_9ROSA|nr:hypothetical protein D8674_011087 [Pyrus ussuriensis x Pyrus communis]
MEGVLHSSTLTLPITCHQISKTQILTTANHNHTQSPRLRISTFPATQGTKTGKKFPTISAAAAVLADARVEFGQPFNTSVGMTRQVELTELDGPIVKISLKGRFWHQRSVVLARLANYLKQRIPVS